MTNIVKLLIGGHAICTSVPCKLWKLPIDGKGYAVVFSDKKPRHTAGVYKFQRGSQYDRIRVIGLSKEQRDWALRYNGDRGGFYLMSEARNALWKNGEIPKSGYVWAEEI